MSLRLHVSKLVINGSNAIGTFGYVTDEIGILSPVVSEQEEKIIKETLQLESVIRTTIAGVNTIGIFIIGKGDTIIVPSIASEEEIKNLEELFKVKIIDAINDALRNNYYVWSKKSLLIAPSELRKEAKNIAKMLNLDLVTVDEKEIELGSSIAGNDRGIIVNPDIYPKLRELSDNVYEGTVNMGDGFVGAGMLINNKGYVVGSKTTGIELAQIDEYLFL